MALLEFVSDGDRPDKKRSARKAQPNVAPKMTAPKVEAEVVETAPAAAGSTDVEEDAKD
jgi:hypothetical protein